uniref:Uncharacterized protein n=1 Tax=Acrobeloides nanus TaxID=290746 RepID=A0A914DYG3_9BILA
MQKPTIFSKILNCPDKKNEKNSVADINGFGNNVLITGANRGLGLNMVEEIAKNYGVKRIFACCRDPDKAKDLVSLNLKYKVIHLIKLDVQNDKSIEVAAEEVKKILVNENLNVLINNAGIFEDTFGERTGGSFYFPQRDYWARHFDINVNGLAMVTAAFLPLLQQSAKAGERALLINMSSTLASISLGRIADFLKNGNVAYSMTKAAVNSYTHLVSKYLEKDGIITTCFCPGWVKTDLGTEVAELTVDQSIPPLMKTISNLKKEQNGNYMNRFDLYLFLDILSINTHFRHCDRLLTHSNIMT